MITIFHGINIPTSRKAYTTNKEKATNPVTLDGAKVTITDLTQLLEGKALFAEEQHIFIEEFFSKRKTSKEVDALISYISLHEKENIIVFWESKELTPKQAKAFPTATIQKFDLPKHIFSLLEAIKPNNGKLAVSLFHQTLETEDAEFIFFMIVRHCRILLTLQAIDNQEVIDEVKRLAPWQKGKLQKQASEFNTASLRNFYNELFTIESGLKTGKLPIPIIDAIDFLLINL